MTSLIRESCQELEQIPRARKKYPIPKTAKNASPGSEHEFERIDEKRDKQRNCLQCKAEGNRRGSTGKPLKKVNGNRGKPKWKRASQTRFQCDYCKAPLCNTGPCWEEWHKVEEWESSSVDYKKSRLCFGPLKLEISRSSCFWRGGAPSQGLTPKF